MFRERLLENKIPHADTDDGVIASTNKLIPRVPDACANGVVADGDSSNVCLFCRQGIFSLLVKLGDPNMPWEVRSPDDVRVWSSSSVEQNRCRGDC